jgi:hypothetical protein
LRYSRWRYSSSAQDHTPLDTADDETSPCLTTQKQERVAR